MSDCATEDQLNLISNSFIFNDVEVQDRNVMSEELMTECY